MKFKCEHCGSDRLGYQSYVRCVIPVEEDQEGNCIYSEPEYDEVSHSDLPQGYCCRDCGRLLSLYGVPVQTESDLYNYLNSRQKDHTHNQI